MTKAEESFKISNISSVKDTKLNFTKVLRKIEEEEGFGIIMRDGKESAAIVPFGLLRKLIGNERFKELLFEAYIIEETEKTLKEAKEKGIKSLEADEFFRKAGWK